MIHQHDSKDALLMNLNKSPNHRKIEITNLLLLAGLGIFAFLNFIGSNIVNGHVLDSINLVLGRDFLNFYHYGLAAWLDNPSAYYDVDFYQLQLSMFFGGHDYTFQQWSYPPHYMLLGAPFAFLNYYVALALFLAISIGLYWYFVIQEFPETAHQKAMWFTPLFFLFALCGQFSAIIAVIFVVIFKQIDKRPILTGCLIALLTIKPQIGLLIPLFLIMTGRWKVFISASMATIAFLGLSILIHGLEPWITYIEVGAPAQSRVLLNLPEITAGIMPTAFVDFKNAGLSFTSASIIHGCMAIMALAAMIIVCQKTQDKFLQYAIFLCATFLLTPYLMMYDMLIMMWVVMTMVSRYEMSPIITFNYICFMLLPILGISLSLLNLPGSFLVLAGLLVWIMKEALKPLENKIAPRADISLA
jgi:hypothetical protein